MIQRLVRLLPEGYVAEPRSNLGTYYEIDLCAFEGTGESEGNGNYRHDGDDGVVTMPWTAPAPSLTIEAELPEQYAYEVLVFDLERERELVAAVEIASPANKDRPESRQLFVSKCATLVQKGVCVSIVDLVTVRHFNLYCELLAMIGRKDPAFSPVPPWTYAATYRQRKVNQKPLTESWAYPLIVGQPLPPLPIWLNESLSVSLDLESSYEDACRSLRIP